MAKQFCYQDSKGTLYPDHPALRFEPNLVPGWYDTDKKAFTPIGNPKEKTGNIITDAGYGNGETKLLSGLKEDKGAMTAPINGVAFSQPSESVASGQDSEGENKTVDSPEAVDSVEVPVKKKIARKVT